MINRIYSVLVSVALIAFGLAPHAFAQQNTLIQTSLPAAITSVQTSFALASVTGINNPSASVPESMLYIVDPGQTMGEGMHVVSVSGTTVTVRRDGPNKAAPHVAGAMVLVATNANWFGVVDPQGSCTLAQTYVTPLLNIMNGNEWLCSSVTGTWVPGFGNTSAPLAPTAVVASAAGAIKPSGPLFHVTGAAAITGFTLPVGFNSGSFTVIPDSGSTWTWTAAGNIALASAAAATVGKSYTFTYDSNSGKFYPSSQ